MILAIILLLVGVTLLFVGIYLDNKTLFGDEYWGMIFSGIGLTIVSATFLMPVSTMIYDNLVEPEKHFVVDKQTEIFSIGNEVGVEGSFVLGSGHIESEMYYFYYVKGESGGIVINKVKADCVEIIEHDSDKAYIIEGYMDYDNPNYFWTEGNSHLFSTEYVRIMVPEGTIKYSYNIQLG